MEALSTYTTLKEIASKAALEYESSLSENPEDYAKSIVDMYRSDEAPEHIKNNVYFRHLLDCYPGTNRNEVVKIISRLDSNE